MAIEFQVPTMPGTGDTKSLCPKEVPWGETGDVNPPKYRICTKYKQGNEGSHTLGENQERSLVGWGTSVSAKFSKKPEVLREGAEKAAHSRPRTPCVRISKVDCTLCMQGSDKSGKVGSN